jgi:hypothetical protein
MPAKSGKQYRFFQAILHGKERAAGPSKKVAKEMVEKTPGDKRSAFMKGKK